MTVRFVNTPLREDTAMSWVAEIRVTYLASDEADAKQRLEALLDSLISNDAVWEVDASVLGEHYNNERLREVLAPLYGKDSA